MAVYGVLYESISFRFVVGPIIDCYKDGNVIQKGQFDKLKKRMLKYVSWCKKQDDIQYLRDDLRKAPATLSKLRDNIKKAMDNPEDKNMKHLRKYYDNGCTPEALDEYINWLKTVYNNALKDKEKEIKK